MISFEDRIDNRIFPLLKQLDFEEAIKFAETEMQKLPDSDYHAVFGITLIDQAEDLADWINQFYQIAFKKTKVEALLF
jgi:hypothetical protein